MYIKFLLALAVLLCASSVDIFLSRAGMLVGGSLTGIILIFVCFIAILINDKGSFFVRDFKSFPVGAVGLLLLFIIWALCSVFYSPDINIAITAFFRYALYFVVAILIGVFALDARYKSAVSFGIFISLIVVCGTIWVDVIYPRKYFSDSARPAGILMNPNAAAQSATILLLLAFIMFKSAIALFIMITFVIISVLATLSRSGFLLLIVCLASGLYLCRNSAFNLSLVKVVSILGIILGGVATTFIYFSGTTNITLLNRIDSIVKGGALLDLDDPRVHLATRYFEIWQQNPLLGYGTASTYGGEFDVIGATHNLYIKILVENGIFGLAIFIVSLLCFLLGSIARAGLGYIFPWSLIFVWGLFANTLLDSRLFYLVIVLLALSPSILHGKKY
ncbi:MAG: O-antigen ligase family protein [Moraxellaceae bacterium]|nr:O-antigen ligase family protein [Moraxellaceae bacterium]MDZ4386023.1 O-antigen ligase family protein [Moraxellaceae bacterium]